ncbi:MAG: thioredoxin-dependent thiol peroxidase [Pseudomonadota bacterium]
MLETNAPAPDFTLPQTDGSDVTLSDLQGQPVVLYFYPKDDTPGCTKESIAFSEQLQAFADAGAKVFGVSKDSVAKHGKFTAKHDLIVPLLSDENGTVCEDYGVWKEKNMYGKTYMGIERTTVLIGADGNVVQVWPKVKVPGHAEKVLEAVQALG